MTDTGLPSSTSSETTGLNFDRITVVKIDADKSKKATHSAPAIYDVYFELSANPPNKWKEIWNNIINSNPPVRFLYKHKRASVEGKYIKCTCERDDAKPFHLPEFETVVNDVNNQYEEYLREEIRSAEAKKQEAEAAERKKREALG